MSAVLAAVGAKAVLWIGGGIALLLGGLLTAHSVKSGGAADQRAVDAQKGRDDDVAATKARSGVDALGDAAVDDKLRGFQRK